jgi:large subunit ribosomal protein L15
VTDLGLHNLHPAAGSHRTRKRVGRGTASGTGKTSGRGQKGQKARSGSHYMRPGFEGGQMPLYMRLGKLRGPHMKKSMPMGPFRTSNEIVNLEQLAERFEAGAEVTPATLVAAGLLKHTREPVKVLGRGELSIALTVSAHAFSASARQKIEAAGGSVTVLERGPQPAKAKAKADVAAPVADEPAPAPAKPKSRGNKAAKPAADAAPAEDATAEEPAPAEEPEASADASDSDAPGEVDETDDAEAE